MRLGITLVMVVAVTGALPSVGRTDQQFMWHNYCTVGGLQYCASVELTLSQNNSGGTDISVRMRNLQGTLGVTPWHLRHLTFRGLVTDASNLNGWFYPGQATLSGSAEIALEIDPDFCELINQGPCPGPDWGQTEWYRFVDGAGRGGFYWTGEGAGPWMVTMAGCSLPSNPIHTSSVGWGSFQTCGDGWVGLSFTLAGAWSFDDNSYLHWTVSSDHDLMNCVPGSNCVQVTPEPVTIALLSTGLLGLGAAHRRRSRRRQLGDTVL